MIYRSRTLVRSAALPGLVIAALAWATAPSTARAQNDPTVAVEPMSWTWGSKRALIEVVEFTDFGCTYCAQFHSEAYGTLFTEYVETGKVRWVFVPFASGLFRGSHEAILFVTCAGEQGKSLPFLRTMLFERQAEWTSGDVDTVFAGYAAEIDLDLEDQRRCVESEAVSARIRENRRWASEAGVRGTPTLFVQGFPLMGALPVAFYRQRFDRAIAAAQRGRRVSTMRTPFPALSP